MVGDAAQPGIMIRALNDLFQVVKDKENEYSVSTNQICIILRKHEQNLLYIINHPKWLMRRKKLQSGVLIDCYRINVYISKLIGFYRLVFTSA